MAKFKIALDAGHGKYTAGKRVPKTMGYGDISEWEMNDEITREQIRLLNQYEGVEILRLDDPTGKIDVPLPTRTNKANQFKADLLISNHRNAFESKPWSGGGLVLFRYPNVKNPTMAELKELYDTIIANGGIKGNRASPQSQANFHMLRESHMPAILIEYGFMDSVPDMRIMMQQGFSNKMAKATVDWIAKKYKLTPKPSSDMFWRVIAGSYQDRVNAEKQMEKLKKLGVEGVFLLPFDK